MRDMRVALSWIVEDTFEIRRETWRRKMVGNDLGYEVCNTHSRQQRYVPDFVAKCAAGTEAHHKRLDICQAFNQFK